MTYGTCLICKSVKEIDEFEILISKNKRPILVCQGDCKKKLLSKPFAGPSRNSEK